MRKKGTILLLVGIIMLITVIIIPIIALSNPTWTAPLKAGTMRLLYRMYIVLTFIVLIIGIKRIISK